MALALVKDKRIVLRHQFRLKLRIIVIFVRYGVTAAIAEPQNPRILVLVIV